MLQRGYSLLTVKSLDAEQRIIRGVATTPTPDRVGDIVEPKGARFKNPLPLLLHHDSRLPVGTVKLSKPTESGIEFEAHLPTIDEPGTLKDRVDEAWQSIKSGLIRATSIGFNVLKDGMEPLRTGSGWRFTDFEILELSLVAIPANQDATIQTIRSLDAAHLAATGRDVGTHPPGVTGQRSGASRVRIGDFSMKTTTEQISAYEATRQAKHARMTEMMTKASEAGVTFDAAEQEEYDGLLAEIEQIDGHLKRLNALKRAEQSAAAAKAVPVGETKTADQASDSRGHVPVIHVKGPNLPKGMAFTRYAMALAAARGDRSIAAMLVEQNKHWMSTTPQVATMLKTAISVGDTASSGWAEELVPFREMQSEFIEFLRPMTLVGRIDGLRRVPFNIQMPVQDNGTVGSWVGEGLTKPVGKLSFDKVNLRFTKVATIVVITEELARHSSPSAEMLVRQDLAAGISQAVDEAFIDPANTGTPDVKPAAVTSPGTGLGGDTASGTTADHFRDDLGLAFTHFANANIPLSGLAIVTTPTLAINLSLMRNPLGQSEFPGLTPEGGSLLGYPVYTSQSVPTGLVVVMKPSEILLADDGGASVDVSREATVLMDNLASPVGTTTVNLWQQNMIGLRGERVINWVRRRGAAVYVIDTAAYSPAPPSQE